MDGKRGSLSNMRNLILLGIVVLTLGAAAPAFGQSASQAPYSTNAPLAQEEAELGGSEDGEGLGPSGADQGGINPTAAEGGDEAEDAGASLPFTGTDLILLLGAGAVFVGFGLTLRRLTRDPNPA